MNKFDLQKIIEIASKDILHINPPNIIIYEAPKEGNAYSFEGKEGWYIVIPLFKAKTRQLQLLMYLSVFHELKHVHQHQYSLFQEQDYFICSDDEQDEEILNKYRFSAPEIDAESFAKEITEQIFQIEISYTDKDIKKALTSRGKEIFDDLNMSQKKEVIKRIKKYCRLEEE